ncbi:Alpha/Beta hydrolase protein [Biscogniauxia sp. FL1348]|nr:Alpha/Beta hydrolase protein [Biscogniauxia sp. FL1348]
MAVDALVPNDPRVEHRFTTAGGFKYYYMLAKPAGKPAATVLLIHGWPDLAMGWRYQVPFLLSLNLQVIVPDMLGYGYTDAPDSYKEYSFKKQASYVASIVKEVTDEPIILGGHDWGGAFIWRMALYYPELIRAIFSICVPFTPPSPKILTLQDSVKRFPQFRYQIQFSEGIAERMVGKSPERLRRFFNGIFGGKTPEGRGVWTAEDGLDEGSLDQVGPSPIVSQDIVEHYAKVYSERGLHGPCNWYRLREVNSEEELPLANKEIRFKIPAMLVMAENDTALLPSMADGQEKYFEAGLKKELIPKCSHWAMVQKPEETNRFIGEFVQTVLGTSIRPAL